MKKILISIATITATVALVIGISGAFFSDSETSTGNTFAAGAIDLLIDNTSYGFDWNRPGETNPTGIWGQNQANSWTETDLDNELFFSFRDLKPGDYGEDTISLRVNDNDAWACMAFDLTGTPENGQNEPEAAVDATAGANEGELQNYLSFLFWYDDGDNVLEDGEDVIESLSGLPGSIFTGNWLAIADDAGNEGKPLPGRETLHIGKGWCFGEMVATPVAQQVNPNGPTPGNTGFTCNGAGDHNDAQTDGIVVDVGFYAVQSRNNEGFLCSSLPRFGGGEQLPKVGALLSEYQIPTCDVTVGEGQAETTVQGGVDNASSGQTVCVTDGTYAETVVIDLPLTLASVNGPTNTATITGGVRVESDNVTVKGFIINPGSQLGENVAVYLNGDLSNVTIKDNDVDGNIEASSRGLITTTSAALSNIQIMNNSFHDLVTGVYLNPHTGNVDMTYNDFDNNTAGVGGFTDAYLAYNEFGIHTDEAVGADSTYDGISRIEFNNFLNNSEVTKYGIWPNPDAGAPAVLAEDNFWNTGGASQTNGNVDFTPEAGVQYPHN